MEWGQPMRVLGRDVAVAEGGGENMVGIDGVLISNGEPSKAFEQRNTITA